MQKEHFKIAGYAVRTTNQNSQAMHDIGALWSKIFERNLLEKIPNKSGSEIIALYYDYAGDHTQPYTCVIGMPVSTLENLPLDLTGVVVPTQTYSIFTAQGEMPDALIETWQAIWQQPLQRNYRFDFEVYDEKSFGSTPEVKIWIGLDEV